MASTTPRYGLPYQDSGDPPNGATLGKNLAEAVEADLGAVEDKVDAYIAGPTRTVITASGTWSKPAGARRVHLICIGGGAAGGGAGATGASQWSFGDGGGAGEFRAGWFNASTFASTVTVTIGAGGTAGTGAGGNGGNTSFGSHMTANGGVGGGVRTATGVQGPSGVTTNVGGSGGSGGDVAMAGGAGGPGLGLVSTSGTGQWGGQGGASHMSASTAVRSGGAGNQGRQYGGGGSGASLGASASAVNGGAGAAGVVIVTVYFNS